MSMTKYVRIDEREVPASVRFVVPGHLAGQHVEIAYGDFGRGEPVEERAPYKRVHDRSLPRDVTYYRRGVDAAAAAQEAIEARAAQEAIEARARVVELTSDPRSGPWARQSRD